MRLHRESSDGMFFSRHTDIPRAQDSISKYKMAAQIANAATAQLVTLCVPGAAVVDLCSFGDMYLAEQV